MDGRRLRPQHLDHDIRCPTLREAAQRVREDDNSDRRRSLDGHSNRLFPRNPRRSYGDTTKFPRPQRLPIGRPRPVHNPVRPRRWRSLLLHPRRTPVRVGFGSQWARRSCECGLRRADSGPSRRGSARARRLPTSRCREHETDRPRPLRFPRWRVPGHHGAGTERGSKAYRRKHHLPGRSRPVDRVYRPSAQSRVRAAAVRLVDLLNRCDAANAQMAHSKLA